MLYGITFIDHRSRTVATGSTLGKTYTAKAILARIGMDQYLKPLSSIHSQIKTLNHPHGSPFEEQFQEEFQAAPDISKAIDLLMRQEDSDRLPFELRKEQKKKKNNNRSL